MLTQKGVPFSWGVTEVTAFQTLKDKMTTGPVLILPGLPKSFEVYCDACGHSLGAVLMQEGRVIAYESRMFSKPEMTAQIYEKELLAVIHALTQWRHYLLGADFTVFTDHQSLRYFLSQKQLSEKQMRWANILSQFHFQIVHVQGHKNVVADALSRKPLVQAISAIHHSTFEDMIDQYATDPDFADIFTRIRDGETVAGYSLQEGYLMRKTMLCVTQPLREKVMIECHCPPYTGHRGIATPMEGIERYFYWPRLKKDVEEFVRSCLVCQKVKFDRHKARGLLQPLTIPTRPWESIAMDFIFDLPRTQSGHDGKVVRDPRFTSLFWKAIWENIGTRLQFSSSFHPQTDKQSEIANSVVLDLLKSYISDQKTQWERYLPLVEFAYNNTIHSSPGKAPFEIVEGAMKKSQERQKKAADRHQRDWKLKENDCVLLRFAKACLRKKKGKEMFFFPKLNSQCISCESMETFGDVPDDGEPDEQPKAEENEEILVPEQVLAHKVTKKGAVLGFTGAVLGFTGAALGFSAAVLGFTVHRRDSAGVATAGVATGQG
ncbi:hypothetical protein L7F22_058618 [Adiantum nelumboides]|nr:hypothetical protein [Adiantum nelumboides]